MSDCIAPAKQGDDPLRSIAALSDVDIGTICNILSREIVTVLGEEVKRLRNAFEARDKSDSGLIGKFEMIKASCGKIEDYHHGLAGRVGDVAIMYFVSLYVE